MNTMPYPFCLTVRQSDHILHDPKSICHGEIDGRILDLKPQASPAFVISFKALSLLFAILIGITGCGWFSKDNTRVPTELEPIQQTLNFREVWRQSIGGSLSKRYLKLYPMIVDERIYLINAQGGVKALMWEQGDALWETEIEEVSVTAGLNGNDELLVLGTEDGDAIALSTEGGYELWRRRLSSEVVAVSQPDLGIIAVRTNDSKIYGLDIGSGFVIWQLSHKVPVLTLKGVSRPVVNSGKLVVGFDDGKIGVFSMLQGTTLWQNTLGVPRGRSELERMVDIDGVIKVEGGIIYSVGLHSQVAAITLIEGRVLWSRELSSHNGLDVDDDWVYVTDDDSQVWALDRRTGASLWKQEKLKYRRLTSPVSIQDYVIVGDYEGYLHWLSKSDGHFIARTKVDSDGILTPPIVQDSRVYILSRGGNLVALDIAAEENENQEE